MGVESFGIPGLVGPVGGVDRQPQKRKRPQGSLGAKGLDQDRNTKET